MKDIDLGWFMSVRDYRREMLMQESIVERYKTRRFWKDHKRKRSLIVVLDPHND